MILLDTSGLLCYVHEGEPKHEEAVQLLDNVRSSLTHSYVLAEFIALAHVRHFSRLQALTFISIVILLHLLKWQYQPECRSRSWRGSIRENRRRVNDDLKDSPSLILYFQAFLAEFYTNAREQAADETGLLLDTFPLDCSYSPEQLLNAEFLPD